MGRPSLASLNPWYPYPPPTTEDNPASAGWWATPPGRRAAHVWLVVAAEVGRMANRGRIRDRTNYKSDTITHAARLLVRHKLAWHPGIAERKERGGATGRWMLAVDRKVSHETLWRIARLATWHPESPDWSWRRYQSVGGRLVGAVLDEPYKAAQAADDWRAWKAERHARIAALVARRAAAPAPAAEAAPPTLADDDGLDPAIAALME